MSRKPEGFKLRFDHRTGFYTMRFTYRGRRYHRSTLEANPKHATRKAHSIYETVTCQKAEVEAELADTLRPANTASRVDFVLGILDTGVH